MTHCFTALVLASIPWGPQGGWSPPPPATDLLVGLEKDAAAVETEVAGLQGWADYSMWGRCVTVRWVYPVFGLTDGSLRDPSLGSSTDYYPLSFWPTDVVGLGPGRLAVAGATAHGKTIIEVFTLPNELKLPSVCYPGDGGPRIVPLLQVPMKQRDAVFETDSGAGHYISVMFRNRGKPDSLLVQFHDTKEIFDFDVVAGTMTKVATTTDSGDASVLVVPGLDWIYLACGDGDHVSLGYVYWFYTPGSSGLVDVLMLVDEDRDGDLDRSESVPELSCDWRG